MNEIAVRQAESYGLVPASMGEAMQLANMMASSKLVPMALQKSPADCLMVIQQAIRWQMDPFAVAQECSVIQGKLMHSGKLVAAVVNARGRLAERLRFAYEGEGDARTITVAGRFEGEKDARTVTVKFKDARTANSMWQKQPDQQLMYHGSRVWARRHTPELMLGVYSPEEFDEAPRVLKKDARADYHTMLAELDHTLDLEAWCSANASRIEALPPDWRTNIRVVIDAKATDPTIASGEILSEQWSDQQAQNLGNATRAHLPPEPPAEVWDAETTPEIDSAWEKLGPVKQAGTLCKDKNFWRFLNAKFSFNPEDVIVNDDTAAAFVRRRCEVKSRAELATNGHAILRWRALVADYFAWQREPAIVESPHRSAPDAEDQPPAGIRPSQAEAPPAGGEVPISLEDEARREAKRGAATFGTFWHNLEKHERDQLKPIGDELRKLMDEAGA